MSDRTEPKEQSKLGLGVIGPAAWRNNTLKEISTANLVQHKADHQNIQGRTLDPLPHIRDVLAQLSNDEAHRYFRQVRIVVLVLRENLIDTNEEIKSLTRGRELLERTIEHIRKDIKLNETSVLQRTSRPVREKNPVDGADDMLHAEKMHLLALKRALEAQLEAVRQQLKVTDKARERLTTVIQERTRVLELINATVPFGRSRSSLNSRPTSRGVQSRNTFSADPEMFRAELPPVDALGPFTPEADAALVDAKDARNRCQVLKRQLKDLVERVKKTQATVHKAVNDGVIGKIGETVELKQRLTMASGKNKNAIARTQKWYDITERTWMTTRGPEMMKDIECREKLARPIIRVFQRHPGNNMPEAQEIIKSSDGLLESLARTGQHLGMLRLTDIKLQRNILDKRRGMEIDGGILRNRRSKTDHRWVMGTAF
jgi:hypothetical protein